VITRSDIGGAQSHVLSLIKAYRHHYEIVLITGSRGFLSDSVASMGVKVHFLFELDSFNIPKAVAGLKRLLISEAPDLVHTHSSLASFYGRAASKMCGLKVLYTVHGWHFAAERNPIKWCIKVCLELAARRFTDYWLVVSEFDLKLGLKFRLFNPRKVNVIVNGIEDTLIKRDDERLSGSSEALEVVFVGRSTYQKNCESALAVMAYTKSNTNLTMFASGGQMASLKAAHHKSPVKSRIKLIIDEPNAASEMHKYNLILITSRYEGMPLGVLEAMRAGLAIVSTDVCGMNELVIQGQNGFLFEQKDIKGIAKQLDSFAEDRSQLTEMGKVSRLRYEQLHTLDEMLQATENVYKKLLNW
jgi:glycosyltransferase involved in cell wall biosynthesis